MRTENYELVQHCSEILDVSWVTVSCLTLVSLVTPNCRDGRDSETIQNRPEQAASCHKGACLCYSFC